jgi:hypothetical protein
MDWLYRFSDSSFLELYLILTEISLDRLFDLLFDLLYAMLSLRLSLSLLFDFFLSSFD